MSLGGILSNIGGFVVGAAEQVVNEITDHLHVPFSGTPHGAAGDVLEPPGHAARSGAGMIEGIWNFLSGEHTPTDAGKQADNRALLARAAIETKVDGATTHLLFTARAPGNDWGKDDAESAVVAVYVDGKYHSSELAIEERGGAMDINLGTLAAGHHEIELRSASDLNGSKAVTPTVTGLHTEEATGLQAQVDAHAPILEFRDSHTGESVLSATHDDAPLVMMPSVTNEPDGTRMIEYVAIYSNENGGTKAPELLSEYGHSIDTEPVYRVHLAADGSVLSEKFQTGVHEWRAFDGDHVGKRPLLRTSSENNMTSARVHDGADRWSGVTVSPMSPTDTDTDVLRAQPWIWQVASKELIRERQTSEHPDGFHVLDPRRYLYIGAMTDAQRGAIAAHGGVEVVLKDGRHVLATVDKQFAQGLNNTKGFAAASNGTGAATLPEGVTDDAVAGVVNVAAPTLVLDSSFLPHEVTHLAQ